MLLEKQIQVIICICDFFNIKYDQNELHNALNDSILVFKLAIKLYEKIEENRI